MARLLETPPFIGTKHDVVVYKRWGNYYVRAKSTLSGKRVKRSAAFKKTMENAKLLGRASKIASKVYEQMREKHFENFRLLTGIAMNHLKSGLTEEQAIQKMGYRPELS